MSTYYGLAAAHLNPIYHQDHNVIPFYTHSISNNENISAYECWQDRSNEDITCCWGSINSPISLENTHFLVKVNTNMPHDPAILLPALCPRDAMHTASGDRTSRFTAALFVRAKTKTTHMPINRSMENILCCVQTHRPLCVSGNKRITSTVTCNNTDKAYRYDVEEKNEFQRTAYDFMFFLQSSKITKTEQFICIKTYDFQKAREC